MWHIALTLFLAVPVVALAQEHSSHLSLKLEVQRAIKLGNAYLLRQKGLDGSWSDSAHPALTALVLTALERDPHKYGKETAGRSEEAVRREKSLEQSYQWLLSQQQEDGGIYKDGLATYNTSTAIMALMASGKKAYEPALLRARAFLVGQQTDWGVAGENDTSYDGGIGYGGRYKHSDLSNTHLALEALYHTRYLALDHESGPHPELDWESALTFINRCQNFTETNDQPWASDAVGEKGGFVYFPGDSKAGKRSLKDGSTALRSYGSMSYAGLLSLVFTDLSATDSRVKAVVEWLGKHFTVTENPGLGQQGLYYYYQVMAKALAAAGEPTLTAAAGEEIDWRRELGGQLVSLQEADGSWVNETARWWENDAVLTTSYAVLALEQLYATF